MSGYAGGGIPALIHNARCPAVSQPYADEQHPAHTVVLSRTNRLSWVALALLVAGAAANAVDRIVTGAVHDWLWLGWAIANIADAWLIVGLGMYMVAAWRSTEPQEATTPSIAGA